MQEKAGYPCSEELIELDAVEMAEVNGGDIGDPLMEGACTDMWNWIKGIIKEDFWP